MSQPAGTRSPRAHLRDLAVAAMRSRGLDPQMPADALAQANAMTAAPQQTEEPVRDLRQLLWCSIDNDDSRDLDQLSVAQPLDDGDVRILVAIADVDAGVPKGSPIDRHAAVNTTSVYTAAVIFPMLPEKLSTDLTSLADQQERLAVVIDFVVAIRRRAEELRSVRRARDQSREARLQQRRRVAGGYGTAAGRPRRPSRAWTSS